MSIQQIGPEEDGRVSLENAEDGDTFGMIVHGRWDNSVSEIFVYTVSRALKRDIVCVNQNGQEQRFTRNVHLHSTYANTASKVFQNFYAIKDFEKRRKEAHKNMKKIAEVIMDTELVEAIESFITRIENHDA